MKNDFSSGNDLVEVRKIFCKVHTYFYKKQSSNINIEVTSVPLLNCVTKATKLN